ncbi:MAG: hypothetical protein Q8P64_18760, partial [Deltaproteobacteria bacterium]|nr:hypothetical protein [Deltaproteobacteria bacterium]
HLIKPAPYLIRGNPVLFLWIPVCIGMATIPSPGNNVPLLPVCRFAHIFPDFISPYLKNI